MSVKVSLRYTLTNFVKPVFVFLAACRSVAPGYSFMLIKFFEISHSFSYASKNKIKYPIYFKPSPDQSRQSHISSDRRVHCLQTCHFNVIKIKINVRFNTNIHSHPKMGGFHPNTISKPISILLII